MFLTALDLQNRTWLLLTVLLLQSFLNAPGWCVQEALEQEDSSGCWMLDDSSVSDRAHSHCQLTEVDLSVCSFMTTAEPRSQSARLAGCCLSYQAVVRVVHPAAPCLPPSARCCWGMGRRSISSQHIGRQRPCFCLCVFESWHSLWTLLSNWSVWIIITAMLWVWRLWLKAKHQEL